MLPLHDYDANISTDEFSGSAKETRAARTARLRYQDIKRENWLRQKLSGLFGRPNHLMELSQALQKDKFVNLHRLGFQTVEIDHIIGSENRADDFDDEFRPIKDYDEERWVRIAELMILNVNLPAVELIKVNGNFFVRDGHHRISVAKNIGQKQIDANVFEWVPAPNGHQPHSIRMEEN